MASSRKIESVAVVGSGTMGMGIAALCASRGSRVVLLDVSKELADKAVERMQGGRSPLIADAETLARITTGDLDRDLASIADVDWICEAVVENLAIKRDLFAKLEGARKDGSIVTTNTSGIPLQDIAQGQPQRLRRDIAVTHFFNPVSVMRLLEVVPGQDTDPEVIDALRDYCGATLGKGLVYAKDTVNFIGNRIGCYWMLAGLHQGRAARSQGLSIEACDALISAPIGLPPTGLYGLIDLVGLDVMDLVASNLAENLPAGDPGRAYIELPAEEQSMLAAGQLGRKTGGGYYRMQKNDDGSKLKQVYDPSNGSWRNAEKISLSDQHISFAAQVQNRDSLEGKFASELMLSTCAYAANLVPQISDDIVNVDRAMRWGFNWNHGPFQLLDLLLAEQSVADLQSTIKDVTGSEPHMLSILKDSGRTSFYSADASQYLGTDSAMHPVPAE